MKTLRIYPTSINERFISEAVAALRDGDIIIYPTDTLYALGCDALNQRAIERLCRLKGIDPKRNTLSIACANLSQAAGYARIDNRAYNVIKDYVPGPFTFILPPSQDLPKVFKGRKEVGIRIPDNPIARALTEELDHPIVTTSVAAAPYDDSAQEPEVLVEAFANIATLLIDGGRGRCEGSAIIDMTDPAGPLVLREGPIPF